MAIENMAKIGRELKSLQGLAVLNLVFGGLAIAFAVSIVVPNILAIVQAQTMLFPQVAFVALGLVIAGLSIRWLASSAEILEAAVDLKEEYTKRQANVNDEGVTALVVGMIGNYRENKSTIKMMSLISRIGGVCFLINGVFNLATMVTGASQIDVLIQAAGTVLIFAMAGASFAIPHFFGEYSKVWDHRLAESAKAEEEFRRQIEEQ